MPTSTTKRWGKGVRFQKSAIVERIRTVVEIMRLYAGWRQSDFAEQTGISASRLSHYLAGHYHPRVDTLAQISDRLGVSLDWLVFGVGPIWRETTPTAEDGSTDAVVAAATMLTDMGKKMLEALVAKRDTPLAPKPAPRAEESAVRTA